MFYLNHIYGGDFELNGKTVLFESLEDAEEKLREWGETGWSILDTENENVLITFDPGLD